MLFSVELPGCYFCAEIKVLGMTRKSTKIIFGIYKKYWKKSPRQGAHTLSTRVGARPQPRGPPRAPPTSTPTPYIRVRGEKKIREKDSSRFTIRSRRQALKPLGRADLESVRGSGEGNPPPSSSSTFLITNFMMLTAVRE